MLQIGVLSRLTIDMLFAGLPHLPEKGEEVRCTCFTYALGGGPPVVPILLGRMHTPVKLGTFLDGSTEAQLAKGLLSEQGCTSYVDLYQGRGQPVTISMVMPVDGDRSIVSYEEPLVLPTEETVVQFFSDCDLAILPQNGAMVQRLREKNVRIVHDTTDFDRSISGEYLSHLEIITPNLREAYAITNTDTPEAAVQYLSDAGVKHPVVKLGAKGCMTLHGGSMVTVPSPQEVQVVDTTGAGDNFLAGLLYGYSRNWDIIRCMEMANVFGSYSTTAVGVFGANLTEETMLTALHKHFG